MSDRRSTGAEAASVDRRPPAEVFALLGNEVRVGILRAFEEDPDATLAFSELFDRVEIEDSGNFTYHLEKLCGSFVRQADGYELTHAGRQVVGAIHAGTYTADATVPRFPTGWDCLLCGGEFVAEYAAGRARITCEDCEKGPTFSFPPGSLDQFERGALPGAFARWERTLVQRTVSGFCHVCSGRLAGELVRGPGGTEADPEPERVAFECERCGHVAELSGSTLASFHPVVEGFFHEHGFDTLNHHVSQVWAQLDRFDSTVLAEDPLRIEIVFGHDGETVVAEIGPDASIVDVERTSSDR